MTMFRINKSHIVFISLVTLSVFMICTVLYAFSGSVVAKEAIKQSEVCEAVQEQYDASIALCTNNIETGLVTMFESVLGDQDYISLAKHAMEEVERYQAVEEQYTTTYTECSSRLEEMVTHLVASGELDKEKCKPNPRGSGIICDVSVWYRHTAIVLNNNTAPDKVEATHNENGGTNNEPIHPKKFNGTDTSLVHGGSKALRRQKREMGDLFSTLKTLLNKDKFWAMETKDKFILILKLVFFVATIDKTANKALVMAVIKFIIKNFFMDKFQSMLIQLVLKDNRIATILVKLLLKALSMKY